MNKGHVFVIALAIAALYAVNPSWAIPLFTLSATHDRPLFSPSRRPPPFTLLGTIIGGRIRLGVFLNDQSKAVTTIREGESNSGWTLRSVDPRSAVLENDGRMVTIELPVVPGLPAGAPAPASPPPVASGSNFQQE